MWSGKLRIERKRIALDSTGETLTRLFLLNDGAHVRSLTENNRGWLRQARRSGKRTNEWHPAEAGSSSEHNDLRKPQDCI